MPTEQELIDILKETRIDWTATPQSDMGQANVVIHTQEEFEQLSRRHQALVGYSYFFVHVYNMRADLALMRCTRSGYWETDIIPQELSPLLPEDMERSVEAAGGTINSSGHYPLDESSLEKVRASYLGA